MGYRCRVIVLVGLRDIYLEKLLYRNDSKFLDR